MNNSPFQGQPQPHDSEYPTTSTNAEICFKCNLPCGAGSVLCTVCLKKYHVYCVEAVEINNSYTCENCSEQLRPPDSPASVRSHRSNVSTSSRSSTICRRNLELQRLEEERQLSIARDREYLKQKYLILEQAQEEEETDRNEQVVESVQNWLYNQKDIQTNQQNNTQTQCQKNVHCNQQNLRETSNLGLPLGNNTNVSIPTADNLFTASTDTNQYRAQNNMQYNAAQPSLTSTLNNNTILTNSSHTQATIALQTNLCPSEPQSTSAQLTTSIPMANTSHTNLQNQETLFSSVPTAVNAPINFYSPHHYNTFTQSSISAPSSGINNTLTSQQVYARQTVPKDLPIFTGKPEEWPLFSSTYDWSTTVCGLTDAENLVRLQKALRAEALDCVQHILIHPSCVPTAISTLKLMYGQPEKILHSLKMKIRNLPIINPNKLDTITSFAVQVKGLEATIEACGLFEELNNSSLLQELVSKLPSYFQINWGTYKMNLSKSNKKINLAEFSNWIFDIGLSASSVNIESKNMTSAAETSTRSKQRNAYVHTHSEDNSSSCIICKQSCRNVANCQKFIAADRGEKWDIVREFELCKQCLGVHMGMCKSNKLCGVDGCQIKHHYLLHRNYGREESKQNRNLTLPVSDKNIDADKQTHFCNAHSVLNHENLFKIIPLTVYGNADKFVETFAFIDEGSSTSLIDEELVKELGLKGTPEPLCLKWTGNVQRKENNSHRLSISVSGPNKIICKADVHTISYLSLPKQTINLKYLSYYFPYIKNLPIQSYTDAVPRILIGLNNSRLCVSKRIREGKQHEPVAVLTRLGWLLYGSMKNNSSVEHHHYHLCDCISEYEKKLNNLVKNFYCLETAGINSTKIMSKEDERSIEIFEKYTKQRPDGHYETSLLWRDENFVMPNSFDMAKKRFLCLEKRLRADNDLNTIFQKTISEYISRGYIEKIEIRHETLGKNIWYLPIFAVFNKNKPGKSRIVWDAAAKSHGISLNSLLMKGPDMLSSLPSILIRFRQKSVAICGDIEQMFHQIFIRKEDQNVQRFLWRSAVSSEPDVYVMKVLIFGASCAPCISQYVKNINAMKFQNDFPTAANAIVQNHYVDDFLDSVDNIEEAIDLAKDVKYIHKRGGFNIRNWLCNKIEVLNVLNENDNQNKKDLSLCGELDADKVLGVFWNSSDDSIIFKLSPSIVESQIFLKNKIPTKRELLRILMTIYDPLGLIGHYLMYLKIVLQEVWRSGIGWDDQILESQMSKWTKWLSLLAEIQTVKIPRCYLKTFQTYEGLIVQLHTFADASENGYAAVSYLRISDDNSVVVSLIGSKTRVSPLKITSIPRLELMAALIATRFANTILNCCTIKIHEKLFWSDSKTVLSWLRSDHRKYHQFVAFRVSEILDTSELNEWRWIAGKFNVADEATKWQKAGPDLSNNSRWINGPEFLKLPRSEWPIDEGAQANTDCELRQHLMHIVKATNLINIYNFSQWRRALRAVAYVLHFISIIKGTEGGNKSCLTQDELHRAECILIKQAQMEEYLEEISTLEKKDKLRKNSPIYKLSPFLDELGVLRIDSRITGAYVPFGFSQPMILPKNSYITRLLILHFHSQFLHCNNETVINEIRQRFHVSRLRTVFKKIVRECQSCKVNKALPINPQMAKLPRARLSAYVAPFTFTGVDFFGPILVSVNRHKEKRYGALFTCLTIRAVHVEIVHSLNTSSCILAIRNFVARRGTPREFYSDNGTNFIGAERELREAIKEVDTNEFIRTFTTATTKWNFNPPAAPHMGGSWERMVRSIKTVLYRIMPTRSPNDETLHSMMAEVENIVNSRPLTYVPIDDETHEALTPNHLLLGRSNGMKPLANYEDSEVVLKATWLVSQQYAQQFWKRWLTEYLPSLTCRAKWFEKSKPLSVGDLVVVVDPSNPRNVWPRGKVLETKVAADGQVRSAKIATACGVLDRPVAKLAIIDVAKDKE